VSSSVGLSETSLFCDSFVAFESGLFSVTNFGERTRKVSESEKLKKSEVVEDSRRVDMSSIFKDTQAFTASQIVGQIRTVSFSDSVLIQKTMSFSRSLNIHPSVNFEATIRFKSTVTLSSMRQDETYAMTDDLSNIRAAREEISTTGYFFALGFLIVTGMAFWIRSAYVEHFLADEGMDAIAGSDRSQSDQYEGHSY
jgi:hypothetical protein